MLFSNITETLCFKHTLYFHNETIQSGGPRWMLSSSRVSAASFPWCLCGPLFPKTLTTSTGHSQHLTSRLDLISGQPSAPQQVVDVGFSAVKKNNKLQLIILCVRWFLHGPRFSGANGSSLTAKSGEMLETVSLLKARRTKQNKA